MSVKMYMSIVAANQANYAIGIRDIIGGVLTSQEKDRELSRKHDAIAELYETHFERVARYITVRIGDIAQGEDLASEVFVRALRSVESFKETGVPMEAWIFKIAHNIVVDYLRSKARKPAFVSLDDAGEIAGKQNLANNQRLTTVCYSVFLSFISSFPRAIRLSRSSKS